MALRILHTIPPPDVLVLVEVSTEEAIRRSGGGEHNDFEHPEAQKVLQEGYVKALREYTGAVERVDNSGPIEVAVERVERIIANAIATTKS